MKNFTKIAAATAVLNTLGITGASAIAPPPLPVLSTPCSVQPAMLLTNGVLEILGTISDDDMYLSDNNGTSIEYAGLLIPVSEFDSIEINTCGGSDTLDLDFSPGSSTPVSVNTTLRWNQYYDKLTASVVHTVKKDGAHLVTYSFEKANELDMLIKNARGHMKANITVNNDQIESRTGIDVENEPYGYEGYFPSVIFDVDGGDDDKKDTFYFRSTEDTQFQELSGTIKADEVEIMVAGHLLANEYVDIKGNTLGSPLTVVQGTNSAVDGQAKITVGGFALAANITGSSSCELILKGGLFSKGTPATVSCEKLKVEIAGSVSNGAIELISTGDPSSDCSIKPAVDHLKCKREEQYISSY